MKTLIKLSLLMVAVISISANAAEETIYKPFIVASAGPGTLDEKTQSTLTALESAGFEVTGQYSPVEGSNIIVVTNDELKSIAAMSDRGGYAAGQRVSVSESGDNIEVAFVNPLYIQYGYRLKGDMQTVLMPSLKVSAIHVPVVPGPKRRLPKSWVNITTWLECRILMILPSWVPLNLMKQLLPR
jgi:hypothetical protein